MGLTDAQMAELEAQQPKKGLTDDEMSALEQQHSQGSSGGFYDSLKKGVGAMADAGANAATLGYLPDLMDARSKAIGGDTGADFNQRLAQDRKDSPVSSAVGSLVGSVPLGIGVGKLVPEIAGKGLVSSALRVLLNSGMGAALGFAERPSGDSIGNVDQRLSNAKNAGLTAGVMSGGLEAGSQVLRGGSAISRYLGKTLGGLSKEEAAAYSRDPQMAEELYKTEKTDPLAFDTMSKDRTAAASQKLQESYIDPRKAKVSLMGAGKSLRVNPSQFEGTAAGDEIAKDWAKQGNSTDLNVPTYEPYKVEASPVEEHISYGKPDTQGVSHGSNFQYESPEVDVSEVQHSLKKAGPPSVIDEGLLPRGNQQVSVPKPLPDSMSLGFEPALRAKRAASSASDIAYKSNPLGLSPADTASAQRNSKAAVDLGKSLEAQAPGLSGVNDELHEALSRKEQLERLGNPSRIFQAGDLPSNVPVRSLRQFLDKNTGSNFQQTADSLFAGRALNSPMDTVKGKYSVALPAKTLLKGAGGLDELSKSTQADPTLVQTIINSLFSK